MHRCQMRHKKKRSIQWNSFVLLISIQRLKLTVLFYVSCSRGKYLQCQPRSKFRMLTNRLQKLLSFISVCQSVDEQWTFLERHLFPLDVKISCDVDVFDEGRDPWVKTGDTPAQTWSITQSMQARTMSNDWAFRNRPPKKTVPLTLQPRCA